MMSSNLYIKRLVCAVLVFTSRAESRRIMRAEKSKSDTVIVPAHALVEAPAASETGSDTSNLASIDAIVAGAAASLILISLIVF
jgi:hypothetical protein